MNFTNALLVLILSSQVTGWTGVIIGIVGVVMLIAVPILALDKSLRFYNRNNNTKTP